MPESLPTLADINVHNSLDERSAAEHFFDKDLLQAEALFRENFLYYQEDLMWMGPRAFCFYVDAAIAYLLNPAASGDSDAIHCFCGVVEFQLENHRAAIVSANGRLHAAVRVILDDFTRYDCDPQIYGDLASRYERLLTQLAG